MKKLYSLIAVLCCCLSLSAQTVTFESADYQSVGVYDMWEASPFRTGVLTGNAAVVENPYKDEKNSSDYVLGVQRSRFGSNMFGARIDLNETFELTTTAQYVHVLIHKPRVSNVMLIGLGKHKSDNTFWSYQTNEVEQFWVRCAPSSVMQDEWFDAVFSIKGAGGIDIHSLIVVVDAESPHALSDDFIAYVDEVEVNNVATSRTATVGDYPICLDKTQTYTRSDRKLNAAKMVSADGTFTAAVSNSLCYNEIFTPTFNAKAGETVTPSVDYKGTWMCSYLYVDWGRDGQFSYDINDDGSRLDGSDLVSWSRINQKDVYGVNQGSNNSLVLATFTIPATTPVGIYRMRYKVDWGTPDPAGNDGSSGSNYILDNGGGYIDVRLNVHNDNVTIARTGGLNGDIVHADGTEFQTESIPFNQPYTIYMQPAPGFSVDSLIVRHGYNLDADQIHKSTPQWVEEVVYAEDFAEDGSFTIPAEWVDGDIYLMPEFVESSSIISFTYDYQWKGVSKKVQLVSAKVGNEYPAIDTTDFPAFTKASKPEGTVTSDIYGTTIVIEIQPNGLPFECFNSFEEVSRWYNVSLKQKYIYDQGTDANINLTYEEPADEEKFVWGFVGDPFDGFRLYNLATHKTLATALSNIGTNTGGNQYPTTQDPDNLPAGYYDVWDISSSTYYTRGFYLAVRGQGDGMYRMNNREDKVAFWTGGADAGSTFCVIEVENMTDITVGVASPDAANRSTLCYDLSGRVISSPRKGLYISDGKKFVR